MTFTGKTTYGAGADLPELVEDVSDIIGIVSPHETPLLDHLGDAARAAQSTRHEWIEDALLPNTDAIGDADFSDPFSDTVIPVENASSFRTGDIVRVDGTTEVLLVTQVGASTITVVRGYGGTQFVALDTGFGLTILANAKLEGAEAEAARFTDRVRRSNFTQIFASTVEVSGSMQAARAHGVRDELDYQKQERMRELLRDLENSVINGVAPETSPQGAASVRRSMNGLNAIIQTHRLVPGQGGIPTGGGELTEEVLNAALRRVWEGSSGSIDTIVVGGAQKRRINGFASARRSFDAGETRFSDLERPHRFRSAVRRVSGCALVMFVVASSLDPRGREGATDGVAVLAGSQ
ncbi:MAG: DUF5309 family protein, partial [Phycisphaerales bacterium]|nr:DUF5309 family protein [Phycisphaerales bacterium]